MAKKHRHQWEPWPIIVPFGVLGFIFPGARCACGTEEACSKDKDAAERGFYKLFGMPFSVFLGDPDCKKIIDDVSRKNDLRALRTAREEDYYLLNRQ